MQIYVELSLFESLVTEDLSWLKMIINFMQSSKKGRKRLIKLIRNQQQIAQDNLFEISCECKDKQVDQSQMLSIEHKKEDQSPQKGDLGTNLINIFNKFNRTHSRIKTEPKKKSSIIENRFQSRQVFVGVKPAFENKLEESNHRFLVYNKTKSTEIFNKYISRSQPFRNSSTQLSHKLHSNTLDLKKNDIHIKISKYFPNRKNLSRQSQKLYNTRIRTNTQLFFNCYQKNRLLFKNATQFI